MNPRIFFAFAIFFLLALVAEPALAQDGTVPMPTTWQGWVLLALFVVIVPIGLMVLRAKAPETENKIDDAALAGLEWLRENKSTIERWLDPNDPEVPISGDGTPRRPEDS